jgi:ribulose-bisphosphate carboxylase small chain
MMRITQGTFSFLPDFTDEQIAAQIRYALEHGWALSVEHTDDPHPRNPYWEMWGLPLFDLEVEDARAVLQEVRACREAHPDRYVKLSAYDSSLGRQTTALSVVVGRPPEERELELGRADTHDRVVRYTVRPRAAARRPDGVRP